MAQAQEEMQQAEQNLAAHQPQQAGQAQQRALNALDNAMAETMKELAQTDPEAAAEALQQAMQNLQDEQAQLQQQTDQSDEAAMAALAQEQQEMNAQAEAMAEMPMMPESAQQAMHEAAQEMAHAGEHMSHGNHPGASKSQSKAMSAMQSASKAMGQSMAMNRSKSPPHETQPHQSKSMGIGNKNGLGRFTYGKLNDMENGNWNVALPPKERAEVEQAVKSKWPAKYNRQVKLYYENLAGAKAEN